MAVLVVLFVLARRQRVVCPGDLEAVRAGASFLLRRAEVVQFGPFLSVRGVAGFVPVEFRAHCTSGRYEVRWPWPLGVALLFVPGPPSPPWPSSSGWRLSLGGLKEIC